MGAGLFGAPAAAGLAQRAEGGGVAAGLGGEVAPEAEHVRPLPELEAGEFRQSVQVPAGADHLPDVAGDGEAGQGAGLSGAVAGGAGERGAVGQKGGAASLAGAVEQGVVEGAGGVGGLGGVLGHVGGDLAHVELCAPGEFALADRVRRDGHSDPEGCGPDGVGEHGGGGRRGMR